VVAVAVAVVVVVVVVFSTVAYFDPTFKHANNQFGSRPTSLYSQD